MKDRATMRALGTQASEVVVCVGRGLLLMPEVALIATLLCMSVVLDGQPLLTLLAVLLFGCFIVRIAALHGARRALELGRYREAKLLAQMALLLHPWSADALALHGSLAFTLGQTDVAVQQFRRAIALLPNNPAFHAALSGVLLDQGRAAEAAVVARQALTLHPTHALAHLYLAEAEQTLGTPATLVEARLRDGLAVATQPEETAALQCGLARHLLSQRRVAEAMLALHSAEALLPRCLAVRQAELRTCVAALLVEHRQAERAREHFRDVELLDPDGRYVAA